MSISVKCPNRECDQLLTLTPDLAGKKGKCPKCGKTFQIPSNLAALRKETGKATPAKQQSASQMPADELAAYIIEDEKDDLFADDEPVAESAGRKPHRRAAVDDEIEDYEEPVVEATVIEGDEEPPRPRRRQRRRAEDYDVADAEPIEEDDDFVPHGRHAKPTMTQTKRWALGSIGFLILSIATCVVGGAFALSMVSQAFAQMGFAAEKASLIKAAVTFAKIGQIVWIMGVIGTITGYAFCLFIPNKRASLGLTIAAISVCVVNLVMGIIFQTVPFFRDYSYGMGVMGDLIGSRAILAGWLGGTYSVGDEILSMFIEFGRYAELMLLALFMSAIAKAQKDRQHAADCLRIVWFLTGMAGAMLVMYIFMFFVDFTADKWQYYIVRIFNWGGNALLTLTFVFLVMNLFYSRSSTK